MRIGIIGGGAAGMFCALNLDDKKHKITVLEKNADTLKKLLITGHGRCNVTNLKAASAGTIAMALDAKDGKSDGKISASIWNEFVADKGGKTIQYSINMDNAIKSISK